MSILDDSVEIPRRAMTLFFVIDKSFSMEGSKIGAVNEAVENVIPMLGEISNSNADAEIKVAALEFSTDCSWLYSEPKPAVEFKWKDVCAEGCTSFGHACGELNSKLSRDGFMKSASGSFAPVIILMSDGQPTDLYARELDSLKRNKWFQAAIKIAIAIGDDADKVVLEQFTGNKEMVIAVHNIEALKQIIRMLSVASSQIGSKSSSANNITKQEQVALEIKDAVKDIDGADTISQSTATESFDDWN